MPIALRAETPEEALSLLFALYRNETEANFDEAKFGAWASLQIRLPKGYHSEIPAPFIEAYDRIQDSIYRFCAFVEHGNADIKSLTNAQLEYYQLRVKVTEGSANFSDNLPEIFEKVSKEIFGKMTGKQAVIAILGLALIAGSTWGGTSYLEMRKEARVEEIRSEERRQSIEALTFANRDQTENFRRVIAVLESQGELGRRAASTGITVNQDVLRAASRVNETEISGNHISQAEARELRSGPRRKSSTQTIEKEMRVVAVNTDDPASTSVIIEDIETLEQHRVVFADELIQAGSRAIVFSAVEQRGTAMFRLLIRTVEGDIVSMDIVGVHEAPPAPEDAISDEDLDALAPPLRF